MRTSSIDLINVLYLRKMYLINNIKQRNKSFIPIENAPQRTEINFFLTKAYFYLRFIRHNVTLSGNNTTTPTDYELNVQPPISVPLAVYSWIPCCTWLPLLLTVRSCLYCWNSTNRAVNTPHYSVANSSCCPQHIRYSVLNPTDLNNYFRLLDI